MIYVVLLLSIVGVWDSYKAHQRLTEIGKIHDRNMAKVNEIIEALRADIESVRAEAEDTAELTDAQATTLGLLVHRTKRLADEDVEKMLKSR